MAQVIVCCAQKGGCAKTVTVLSRQAYADTPKKHSVLDKLREAQTLTNEQKTASSHKKEHSL